MLYKYLIIYTDAYFEWLFYETNMSKFISYSNINVKCKAYEPSLSRWLI